jgi:hypothetical protein
MAILNATSYPPGLVDVIPSVVYLETNDTVATVTTTGYLNKRVQQGFIFQESMMALVSTKTAPNAAVVSVGWYDVSKSGENWSLIPSSGQMSLADGLILVGNAGGIAAPVAMSGDATIVNTGALTIAANAITTAKILNANVTLAKLAAGITPSHIIKFAGKDVSAGGSATVVITAAGVAATDIVFAQIQASANAVNVQKVTPTTNTITVLCSADPGAVTISYQALRAAT